MSASHESQGDNSAGSRWLEALVFAGGVCGIGLEIATSRLIAPYFGSSTFIWANLIGLTLTYLAIGYYLGGRVADARPEPRLLFAVTAVAAIFTALIPVMSRPILRISLDAFDNLDAGAFYGSLLGTLLLLAVPMTLLGFVTPFAIRLRVSDLTRSGQTAGRLYALSTVGSILGSFLPVILLIPVFGTTRTFVALAVVLAVVSTGGLLATRARLIPVAAVTLLAFSVAANGVASARTIKPPYRGQLMYETESEYNYIQVLQDGPETLLALNEGHAVHSIYNPDALLTGGPWDYFMVAPLFLEHFDAAAIDRAAMIGLAGGTAVRELAAVYPSIAIDGVEIDRTVVEVARRYFAMNEPNLNVVIADGRYFLRTTDERYDIVGIDAYRQPYIPFQLTTREFFQEVAAHLEPGGVAVVNAGRTSTDFRLVDALASTMASVFSHVFLIDVDRYDNTMVIGTNDPASIDAFWRNAGELQDGPLREVAMRSIATGGLRPGLAGSTVYTDDRAPVEELIDRMILDAARNGGE